MKSQPFVSVIILNYNGKAYLKECLESLRAQSYPKDRFEVILGDNASTDDSLAFVSAAFPEVKIRSFKENFGFCKANNLAAQEARGEYLIFLNNDTFVSADWIAKLVERVLSDRAAVCCASKILFADLETRNILNAAGGWITPAGGGVYEGWLDQDSEKYNRAKETGFGCAAGVLVSKDFFLGTGGFDEYYFYSNEEMDLGYRVWASGHKVLYEPQAVMYHYMGRTGLRDNKITPSMEFLITRNNLYFMLKNFEAETVFKGLFLFLIRVLFKILNAVRYGKFLILPALLRAFYHTFKDFPGILEIRKKSQSSRKVRDRALEKQGVLLTFRGAIHIYSETAGRSRKASSASLYDNRDRVKVRFEPNGEARFYKPQ